MAFTHYLEIAKPLTALQFEKFSARVNLLYKRLPPAYMGSALKIRGPNGFGRPRFTSTTVAFNGDATQGQMLEYLGEPFIIKVNDTGDLAFKTQRKPYDFLVQAALLCFIDIAGKKAKLFSDGKIKDWKNAKQFFRDVFKKDAPATPEP